MYEVKLEVFEGPFDLLFSLVTKQELDIHDVPIARIAQQYLDYLRDLRELDLEVTSEFLLVAATLLDMKAASLLAAGEQEDEESEQLSADEVRRELIARLIEYKQFKNVAVELAARLESQKSLYPREVELEECFTRLLPDFLEGVELGDLSRSLVKALLSEPVSIIDSEHITPAPLSLEGPIERIRARLGKGLPVSFRDLTADATTRLEIIIAFLSVLELYKRGEIQIGQAHTFGDIKVTPKDLAAAC